MRSRLVRGALSLFCAGVLSASMPAQGAILQYFGEDLGPKTTGDPLPNADAARTTFLSNLVNVGVETFDSYAAGTNAPLGVSFGADTATLNGGGLIRVGLSTGRFPISGDRYWETNSNFSVSFSSPQAAFGFYGTDIGDFQGQLSVRLNLNVGGFVDILVPHTIGSPNASALYFGVIGTTAADLIDSVQFSTTTGEDFFGFDNLTIGRLEQVNIVPEPASMALWGLGGVVLAVAARRRRK